MQANVEKELFYCKNGIIVRRSVNDDVISLRYRLKKSDIDEVWSSSRMTPDQALKLSLKESIISLTVEKEGLPIAMFGICPKDIIGNSATIWMLSSDDIDGIAIRFAKHSRYFVNMFLEYYPLLWNYVDGRNKKTIAWLRFIGAKIDEAVPYGFDGVPFHYFTFGGR